MSTVGRHRLGVPAALGGGAVRPRATARVVEDLKQLGPFFALQIYVDERAADQWRPLRSLFAQEALERRAEQMTRYLAAQARLGFAQIEPQVSTSVMHLGLVARLISPFLGLAAQGHLLRVELSDIRWIPSPGSNFALSISPELLERDRLETRDEWAAQVVANLIEPLTGAVLGSQSVLWGNVASALHGAVAAVQYTRPSLAPTVREVADHVLHAIPGPVRCAGELGSADFRRSSCCLIYRVGGESPATVCGDCVLRDLRATRS